MVNIYAQLRSGFSCLFAVLDRTLAGNPDDLSAGQVDGNALILLFSDDLQKLLFASHLFPQLLKSIGLDYLTIFEMHGDLPEIFGSDQFQQMILR